MGNVFIALVGTLTVLTASGCAQHADLAIVNARVWTGVAEHPSAEAVAVCGERIEVVGTEAEVRRRIGPKTRVIDAGGRRVIPGLIDCHTHIIDGGLQLTRLRLREVGSREAFIAAVAQAAAGKQPGQWVFWAGTGPSRAGPILSRATATRAVFGHWQGI